jgi:cytochrome c5
MLKTFFAVVFLLMLVIMLGAWSWISPDTIVSLQQATATRVSAGIPMPPMSNEDSWVIVDLPPDATQLEYGAEVYRLVCKACHGDTGQGLTDDWRAQWAPEDQNCWQSKCHAANHPPDGFYMPISPAVVGPPLQMFETAQDLYNYIHNFMPWHDRGSMTEKDSWSVTAHILKMNNIDPGPELSPETASQIRLRASGAVTSPSNALPQDTQPGIADKVSPIWIAALIVAAALAFIGLFVLIRRAGH